MKTKYPLTAITFQLAVFALFTAVMIFLSNNASAQLKFSNLALETGSNKEVGAVYRAKTVYTNIDALISIDSLVNGASIVDIDQQGAGFDEAFQPKIQSGGTGISYAVFTIRFVKANTSSAEVLGSLTATNLDLDGNNQLKEFCELNLGGGSATFMHNTPEISVTGTNGKFLAQNVSGNEYTGIDTSADAVMFKVNKSFISQLSIRLGATVSNNSQSARQYSVYMKDFEISNPATLPLTILNFSAVKKEQKVTLNWATTEHKNFSHFVVQRSTDSKNFKDIMTMLTDDVLTSSVNHYNFIDNITDVNSTTVYYRLLMVDNDGSYQYSAYNTYEC
jgi:hypothetical protein